MPVTDLQSRFAIPGRVAFRRTGAGQVMIDVTAAGGHALVCLRGAQVLSFSPTGQPDILWLSPTADVDSHSAMRGGVPVCWPWFGTHPSDAGQPMHGFARTAPWELVAARQSADDVELVLAFTTGPEHAALWPHTARARLTVTVGTRLALQLVTENIGSSAFDLTQALHAYFRVDDVERVSIDGLDGVTYQDKTAGYARRQQRGAVRVDREVDRIYADGAPALHLIDESSAKRIAIAKRGSHSTVVWNPWVTRGASMPDVGAVEWRHFVCVETANAGDDVIRLAPGAQHALEAIYGMQRS